MLNTPAEFAHFCIPLPIRILNECRDDKPRAKAHEDHEAEAEYDKACFFCQEAFGLKDCGAYETVPEEIAEPVRHRED